MNQYEWIFTWNPYWSSDSLSFYLKSSFCSRIYITFSHPVSLGTCWARESLRLSLFLMTLSILRNSGQIFVECPSLGTCLAFFSWLDWGCGLGKEDHRNKVPISSHHFQGTYYQHDLSLLILTLITWLRKCLSDFSNVLTFPPTLSKISFFLWLSSKYSIVRICFCMSVYVCISHLL